MLSLLFIHFSLFKLGVLFKLKEARETFVRDLNIFLPILAHVIRKKLFYSIRSNGLEHLETDRYEVARKLSSIRHLTVTELTG